MSSRAATKTTSFTGERWRQTIMLCQRLIIHYKYSDNLLTNSNVEELISTTILPDVGPDPTLPVSDSIHELGIWPCTSHPLLIWKNSSLTFPTLCFSEAIPRVRFSYFFPVPFMPAPTSTFCPFQTPAPSLEHIFFLCLLISTFC